MQDNFEIPNYNDSIMLQKYITSLKPDYPVITTHWHEEAEFTLITEGDASYQIDLTSYAVEKDDLIFIPPLQSSRRKVYSFHSPVFFISTFSLGST